jgi:hypothetical protein
MERGKQLFEQILKEGESFIDTLIEDQYSEEYFLDFKRVNTDLTNRKLSQPDKENLAKAISGFGNSEGGIIIWGIDCSPNEKGEDVAHTKYPITNIKKFKSLLQSNESSGVIPPPTGIEHLCLKINASGEGYVVTYIPKSDRAPHQYIFAKKNVYYIRVGSMFEPAPHGVIAGMFGKRPSPHVFNTYITLPIEIKDGKIQAQVGIAVRNSGPGIAKDIFANIEIFHCPFKLEVVYDLQNCTGQNMLGRFYSLISNPTFRLPPESQLMPYTLTFTFTFPVTDDLDIEGLVGCSNSPSYRFDFKNKKKNLNKIIDDILRKHKENTLTEKDRSSFIERVLTIPKV